MKKLFPILTLFGILAISNINIKSPESINAWMSYKSKTYPWDLDVTFISEEETENGNYCYKYHIKNISDFYIYDLGISGYATYGIDEYRINKIQEVKCENNLFNYKTLLFGPNQEIDVDFYVQNKFENVEELSIYGYGFDNCSGTDKISDAYLSSNVVSLSDPTVHLVNDFRESNYNYYAILKTTINGEEYYLAAEDSEDYGIFGNFVSELDEDFNVELVEVIRRKIPSEEIMVVEEDSHIGFGHILLGVIAYPALICLAFTTGIVLIVIATHYIKRHLDKKKKQTF